MGTFVTMEALRTLSISGEQSTVGKIDALILAAPDIDIDVFRSQLADIPVRPKTMLVLVSAKDRALKISSGLRGGKERVGSGANKEELVAQGMIVLDVATLREKGDQLSHSTFSNSEELIRLVTGGLSLNALERAEKGNPVNLIGEGFGAAGDLISSIVYLPAQIAGAR
jgi:esterase/lipase superfamily enzyme